VTREGTNGATGEAPGVTLEPGGIWRNWGRSHLSRPAHVVHAASVADVVATVLLARDRGLTVRPIGAGHSFSGIAATDGIQLDISALEGVIAVDGTRVTLGAGTNLHQLPEFLGPLGLALTNMGDIDKQTFAGAVSTGTHGTGSAFGGISTQIVAMTLVTATGEILRVSDTENAELLPAVALGLGALGIIVDLTIECVPQFMLSAVDMPEPLESVLEAFDERSRAVDHFEFYWFPHTDTALTKSNSRVPATSERRVRSRFATWFDEELLSNGVYRLTSSVGVVAPAIIPSINRLADKLIGDRAITDASHAVFAASRSVRFQEMEYALPREHIPAALRAIRSLIAERGWRVSFPIEVRVAASDDLWLSTASGRESGYIAVHRYYREDPEQYFRAVEQIMRRFSGRPHWGKMHYQDAESLESVYPHFAKFVAVRDRLDPERLFGNPYLARVLG
jgi:L-gulono-1,4-lactone dehydrogenase